MTSKLRLMLVAVWAVFFHFGTMAQSPTLKPVSNLVLSKKKEGANFATVPLFTKVNTTANERGLTDAVSEATFLQLDIAAAKNLLSSGTSEIELVLPYQEATLTLEFVEVELLTDDFSVVTSASAGQAVSFSPGKFYRGMVKGNPQTLATLSVFENEVMCMVSPNQEETLVLGKLKDAATQEDYILYSDKNLLAPPSFTCNSDLLEASQELKSLKTGEPNQESAMMTNCVRQYLEADYALYSNKGSIQSTVNYLLGLFNEVSALFANESISTSISQIYVWVSPDNYSTSSSLTALNQLKSYRPNFNGDLALLAAMGGNNTGGVAFLDGLCSATLKYAYADIEDSYSTVPTYSWSVFVMTHEIGHNYGSPHTHACAWGPDGDEPLDCCGANAGLPEVNCEPCNLPNPPSGGTIMSYCHLTGVGVNFTNGFGDEPGALILSNYNAASCLTTCSSPACNMPTNLAISNIQTSQATFSWTAASGATSYNVQIKTNSGSTWNTFNTQATMFTITGFSAGQTYNMQVETVCASGTSGYTTGMVFTTTVACPPAASNTQSSQNPVCAGKNFTLSLSMSYGSGYTFQWESSPDGAAYSDISGATSSTLVTSQTASTWYRCNIDCSVQNINSTPLQVTMENDPTNCYCTPAATTCSGYNPSPYMRINQVILGDLNNANNTCSTNGYGNYLSGQTVPNLPIGGSEFITINVGDYQQRQTVFIDFNQDGDFDDANESTNVPYYSAYTQMGAITVPTDALTGQTHMRVRSKYWNDGIYPTDPCSGGFGGETEDYLVNIVPCSGTCYPLPQATQCSFGSNFFRITRVQLGTLDNQNNSCSSMAGYQDYTTGQNVPNLTAGSSSTLSVSISNYSQRIAVFIDYNRNGSYNDAGETIEIPYAPLITQTISIAVPSGVSAGTTRMRVRSRNSTDNLFPTAYNGGYYGETEEYTVNIQSLLPVELVSFTAKANGRELVDLHWETASELNTSHFTIQRSRDGIQFFDLESLSASGNSSSARKYESQDRSPFGGTNYYRLKMVDLDGTTAYSPIVQVEMQAEGFALLEMYPNPAKEGIQIRYRSEHEQPVQILLADVTGKKIQITEKASIKGENLAELPLSDLLPGVYFITIYDGVSKIAKRLVKY